MGVKERFAFGEGLFAKVYAIKVEEVESVVPQPVKLPGSIKTPGMPQGKPGVSASARLPVFPPVQTWTSPLDRIKRAYLPVQTPSQSGDTAHVTRTRYPPTQLSRWRSSALWRTRCAVIGLARFGI